MKTNKIIEPYKPRKQKRVLKKLIELKQMIEALKKTLNIDSEDELKKRKECIAIIDLYWKLRDELIEHNVLLSEYAIKNSNIKYLKIPYTEKESIAYEALVKAIDHYIENGLMEYELSTFVMKHANWIAYNNCFSDELIEKPKWIKETLLRIRKFNKEYENKYGRIATLDEIAKSIEIPEDKILKVLANDLKTEFFENENNEDLIEFDEKINTAYNDILSNDPADVTNSNEIKRVLFESIKKLPWSERTFLVDRFGLYGNQSSTYEEIAKKNNVSIEGARKTVFRAVDHLKKILSVSDQDFFEQYPFMVEDEEDEIKRKI